MIKVSHTGIFNRNLEYLLIDQPLLKSKITKAVDRFVRNPQDTRLELHPLKKRLKGKYAIGVTDDIRIVFEWLGKNSVRFLAIGPHYKIYPGYQKKSAE